MPRPSSASKLTASFLATTNNFALPVATLGAFLAAILHPALPLGNLFLFYAVLWICWRGAQPEADDSEMEALKADIAKIKKDVTDLTLSKALRK